MKRLLIAACIFFTFPAQAQSDTSVLNPVTISSSLHPVPSSRTGRNIISIPGERFSKLPAHSIDELLRYVPGVEVQTRGPQGSQSDIVLRGGTFQQVLIILDGIRLNDPNTGHFNSYIPIAPSEIERIEVLKGASSAIYGSEAVGGVISIVTKSFAAKKNQAARNWNAAITVGEYNLVNARAGLFWQKNNTAISAGILSNNTDGQLQRGDRGYFNNHTASISLNHFINEQWSFSVRTAYDQRSFAAQNFYTTFASDTAEEEVSGSWNQARVNFQAGRHRISLDAGFKSVKDIYRYNPSSSPNNNRSRLLQLLLTDHFLLNNSSTFVTGLQYQHRTIRSNDRGNHTMPQAAFFMVLHKNIQSFSLSPSLRVDHVSGRGTELVPQINLSWQLMKFQLRASAGKTIRDADFTERFNNYNKALVTGGSVGNPDLVAETSFSYEAGVDYISGPVRISLTGFQRRQNELIDWITTPYSEMPRKDNLSPTGTFALARNIADVNTSGLELDLYFDKKLSLSRNITAMVGLTWLDSKSGNDIPSFYLSSHARFMANFNIGYDYKRFSLHFNGIYKHRRAGQEAASIHAAITRDYFVANARAGIKIPFRDLLLFMEVDDIMDAAPSDLLGSRLPGRWWMTGASLSF